MANKQTDSEGNLCIESDCGRLRADYFPDTETFQVDSELEDVERDSLIDWCEAVLAEARKV